ncbi:DUF2471 family protein [Paraburkholderia unamae]|uniref:DUF2471 family protein n=1 Tax=Paraburkholderia unamae TaxID=219649 RepID=UPI003FD798A3
MTLAVRARLTGENALASVNTVYLHSILPHGPGGAANKLQRKFSENESWLARVTGTAMEDLLAAQAWVQMTTPAVVAHYRSAGVLTWNLLHAMEEEVLESLEDEGYPDWIVDMLRAPHAPEYPHDDHAVSFEAHDFIPPVFAAIDDEWRRAD